MKNVSINAFLKRVFRFTVIFLRIRHINGAWFLSKFGNRVIMTNEVFKWQKNQLCFEQHDILFSKENLTNLGGNVDNIAELLSDFKIKQLNKNNLNMSINCNNCIVNFNIDSAESVATIKEIFKLNLYEFYINKNFVVLDIGLNIGAASLYFATYQNIHKIYGYEPFESTYLLAKANISNNPLLEQKIELYNYGIGVEDEQKKVPLMTGGYAGASTTLDYLEKKELITMGEVTVNIKNISPILLKVISENKNDGIILKVDCEGAEYEIIEKLYNDDLLKMVSYIILEWHYKGKEDIEKYLKKCDFIVLSQDREAHFPVGILYAINKNIFQ